MFPFTTNKHPINLPSLLALFDRSHRPSIPRIKLPGLTLLLVGAFLPMSSAIGHSIDYLATDISPSASFSGASGNFVLTNDVAGGTEINFNLTFSINTQGSTTEYPIEVTFGVADITKPLGAEDPSVSFGNSSADTFDCNFTGTASSCITAVKIIAPSEAGAYSVKVGAIAGTGGGKGLSPGSGVVVNFTVKQSLCEEETTSLTLDVNPRCIVVGNNSVTLTATLLSNSDTLLSGKTIEFNMDGNYSGSEWTGDNGEAILNYDSRALAVGDHTVQASFQGETCAYGAAGHSAILGVVYNFLGFQPPIQNHGNSIGLFSGNGIPVKIKITDANGYPVIDAEPHVFFTQTSANISTTDTLWEEAAAITNPDSGNTMRYDPFSDQYIFNWNTAELEDGAYHIWIDLGEGSCGDQHRTTVNIQRKGRRR